MSSVTEPAPSAQARKFFSCGCVHHHIQGCPAKKVWFRIVRLTAKGRAEAFRQKYGVDP